MKMVFLSVSVFLCAGVQASSYAVATARVDVAERAFHARAVHDETSILRWAYPDGARSATVTITGLAGHEVFRRSFAPPVVTCAWTAVTGDVTADNLFTVTVSFDVGEPLSAEVALLKSSFGGGAVVLPEGGRQWTRISDTALIPYNGAWVEGGASVFSMARRDAGKSIGRADSSPGWYGWRAREWGSGWFDLSFLAEGAESGIGAQLLRIASGSVIAFW